MASETSSPISNENINFLSDQSVSIPLFELMNDDEHTLPIISIESNPIYEKYLKIVNENRKNGHTLVETIIFKNIDSDKNTKIEYFQEETLISEKIDLNCTKNKRKREKTSKLKNFLDEKSPADVFPIPTMNQKIISKKKTSTVSAKNFPKILGQTVIRFVMDDLFANRNAIKDIYIKYNVWENETFDEFKLWVKEMYSKYTNIPVFRKVWLQEFGNVKEDKFCYILTEMTKKFLYKESYNYFISNSGTKFKNFSVVEKYLKCIPIFIQGISQPKYFTSMQLKD